MHIQHDIGIARQIGTYSDGLEVAPNERWLFSAGTPGLAADGNLPADITGQAEATWANIVCLLQRAGMTVHHLVKISQYLTRAEDIPAYGAVRAGFLGEARPASMLLVVPALVRPSFLLEVEITAAAPVS